MCNETKKQGMLISKDFVLTVQETRVWLPNIIDQAKGFSKPVPMYTGSARLEGKGDVTLFDNFIKRGFQPCALKLVGVRMHDKTECKIHTFMPKEGMVVVAVVRYAEVGRPEIRIVTQAAPAHVTERYGWDRVPVKAEGEDDRAKYRFAKNLVMATAPVYVEPEPEAPSFEDEPYLEADPFAA
jgi:hypothetical protein